MSIPFWSLLAFCFWTMALVLFGIGPYRIIKVWRRELRPSDIKAEKPHGSERFQRLMRAHLNCVENLPLFGSLVFLAHATGYQSGVLDGLCIAIVVLRLGQSTAHIVSGRGRAVQVRFGCFLFQLLAFIAIGGLTAWHSLS